MFFYLIIAVISYFLGSLSPAYLLSKLLIGKDIRKFGSGNVGGMNTFRVLKEKSKTVAILGLLGVAIVDMAKGASSIFLCQKLKFLDYDLNLALVLAGFFVVLGHNYSIFLKFQGGKGLASLIGILLYLEPLSLLIWGFPILFSVFLVQIILEKLGKIEKIDWKRTSEILKLTGGKQILGIAIGSIFASISLYFYNLQILLPVTAGIIPLLIKHLPRFEEFFKEIHQYSKKACF